MVRKWGQEVSRSPKFERGSLLEFGYSPKKSTESRRRALARAVKSPKHSGYEVWHKLDFLAKMTERTQPHNSRVYRADAEWVKNKFIDTHLW